MREDVMRAAGIVLLTLTVASALWATVAAYRIGGWLTRHGVKVNWFLYRLTMLRHIHQYRKMTTESDGKAGPLYAHFLVAINLALVLAVAALISFAVARR
jgi:hypothetical protein